MLISDGSRTRGSRTPESAPLVGASMVMFAVYNATAARREATKHAFDSMFPRGSLSSPFTRNPVVKFALTKPIARVVGNPRLSAAALTYILLVKMGKSIRESGFAQEW